MSAILETFHDQNNLNEGLNRRIYYKSEENEALFPAYKAYADFQAALNDPSTSMEDVEDLADLFLFALQEADVRRRHWIMVDHMESKEQSLEYENMRKADELSRVSQQEIEQLLKRREALELKLSHKIEYEKQMENVRKQPSRAQSTQAMADLELEIEGLQQQINDQGRALAERQQAIARILLTVQDLGSSLKQQVVDREKVRRELKEQRTVMTAAATATAIPASASSAAGAAPAPPSKSSISRASHPHAAGESSRGSRDGGSPASGATEEGEVSHANKPAP